jgi:hypothetical protein
VLREGRACTSLPVAHPPTSLKCDFGPEPAASLQGIPHPLLPYLYTDEGPLQKVTWLGWQLHAHAFVT